MKLNNNLKAFLKLVKAGLWEKAACLKPCEDIDFQEVYRVAQEQSVVGLVAAGFEHVKDVKIPQEIALSIVGETLQLEQRNIAMNSFINVLVDKMRNDDIYTILVKGQGLAQCYERPLWRASGDVDLLFSESNYEKAKDYLSPLSTFKYEENIKRKHLGMNIDSWEVELHGSLRSDLWGRMDSAIDDIQNEIFYGGAVRLWKNGDTQVVLPRVNEDVVLVFSHILQHFYQEGIGLRQICDWCRLLWTFRDSIDRKLLRSRLLRMGIMTEWKAFGALTVHYLNMPEDAMPFYEPSGKWLRKANRILSLVLETGNFGHNIDKSYKQEKGIVIRKLITFCRTTKDMFKTFSMFPLDSLKVWWRVVTGGVLVLFKY